MCFGGNFKHDEVVRDRPCIKIKSPVMCFDENLKHNENVRDRPSI